MPKELEYYRELKMRLDKRDAGAVEAFVVYDTMYHSEWELPTGMPDWVRAVPSSDPHDAVEAGVRTTTSLQPKITLIPTKPDPDTKADANEVERNLQWQLKAANMRRPRKVEADVMESCLKYMATAVHVVDLEWQREIIKANGGNTSEIDEMLAVSRFSVEVEDPKDVRVERSRWGTHGVLITKDVLAEEVAREWGLQNKSEFKDWMKENAVINYNDYMDRTDRVIWVEGKTGGAFYEIMREEHGLPFIPWAADFGASGIEKNEADKYHPLLYAVRKTGMWDTQNIARSLMISEVIRKAADPDFFEEGSNPEQVEIDYTDITREAKVPPGNTVKFPPQRTLDRGLAEIVDRTGADMSKATVSQILMGGSPPAGAAYSTVNLATQTALGSLKPARELAQKTLAEVFILMILWSNYTGRPLIGYNDEEGEEFGTNYLLDPLTFDRSSLYLEVELTPDAPTDRLQKANTGRLLKDLGYPTEKILEEMGIEDPQAAVMQSYLEEYVRNQFDMAIELKRAEQQQALSLQFEQMRMQMQAQFQQQMQQVQMQQQQQQQMFAQQQQQEQAQAQAEEARGIQQGPFPGGPGFDPSVGGIPAQQAAGPDANREQVTQQDMGGNPVADLSGGLG